MIRESRKLTRNYSCSWNTLIVRSSLKNLTRLTTSFQCINGLVYLHASSIEASWLPSLCQTPRPASVLGFVRESLYILFLDYDQNILEFTSRTYAAEQKDPDIWQRLLAGEFAVTTCSIPFTSIGIDQAQEHDNKLLTAEGGLQGITLC